MKTKLILITFLTIFCSAISANNDISYYANIIELHNGPIKYHKDQSNPYDLGVRYRAVIAIEEIYYILIVEKIQVEDEGGLIYISNKLVKTATHSKIKFIKWKGSNSFEILLDNKVKIVNISISGEGKIEN